MGNIHSNEPGRHFNFSAAPPGSSASTAAARSRASCWRGGQRQRRFPRRCRRPTRGRPHGSCTPVIPGGSTTLTLDYGLRWDYYSPSSEKYDRFSFFDPVGANPGAGGRPGRLAFAGDTYGAASYGARYPEEDWYGGFAPRLGAVYSLNEKTVVRTGWGIFYTQAYYPGWGGGISQDGFSNAAAFSSTLGGIQPAFYLVRGCRRTSSSRPTSAPATGTARASSIVRSTPTSVLRAPVEHLGRPRAGRQPVAERRLRRQRGPAAALEHGAAERDRSRLSVAGRSAERRVPAGHDQPQRRAPAVSGLGGTDDRLRAVGGAGAASLSAVPATTCRG